jgi:hypothetical protein
MAAFLDVCRFNPAAGGTSDWTYASAVTGYQSPAAAGAVNGRLYKYRAESTDLSQWEVGEGAYSTSTGVLARTSVLFNSAGTTSKINFGTVPQVAIVALKEDLISVEEANGFTAAQRAQARSNISAVLRGQIWGLWLSTAGSSVSFGVSAGEAADSTASDLMVLATGISKTTAAWSVGSGNGGLDTGTIAANAWYHAFLIKRPDTGLVDVLFSLSPTAPTLPANYTLFRRIFSMKTDGTSQWRKMVQFGDEFLWDIPGSDVNTSALGATSTFFTLASVPTGVQVIARIRGYILASASGPTVIVMASPDEAAASANVPAGNFQVTNTSTSVGAGFAFDIRTNTSGQIRAASNQSNTTLTVAVYGWVDRRGRDS